VGIVIKRRGTYEVASVEAERLSTALSVIVVRVKNGGFRRLNLWLKPTNLRRRMPLPTAISFEFRPFALNRVDQEIHPST